MIIVKLIGGLGNQMFRYAAGKALSEKHGVEFKIDITAYEKYKLPAYQLDYFLITAGKATPKEIPAFSSRIESIFGFLKPYPKKKVYHEPHFHFDKHFFTLPNSIYLNGHFQSEKYFKSIENTIRQDFSFKEPEDTTVLQQIRSSESVSLHVRRGNYVTDKKTNAFQSVPRAIKVHVKRIKHFQMYHISV